MSQLFATTWTTQFMEFSRPEYWSGQPFPSPEDLPTQGLNPGLPHSRWILYQLSRQGSMVLINELLSGILGFLSCTVLGSPVISNHLVYSCYCLVYHGFIIIYSQTLTSSLWLFSCQVMSNFL